jgi:hypothetical protein
VSVERRSAKPGWIARSTGLCLFVRGGEELDRWTEEVDTCSAVASLQGPMRCGALANARRELGKVLDKLLAA